MLISKWESELQELESRIIAGEKIWVRRTHLPTCTIRFT
jgi:hypothetical protein